MTWDIVIGLITLIGALIAVMNVVVRVNRTLTALEAAVERLNENMRGQSEKNKQFYDRLGSHETRISLLEQDGEGAKSAEAQSGADKYGDRKGYPSGERKHNR